MLVLNFTTNKEIPEFCCASSEMTWMPRNHVIPANAGISTFVGVIAQRHHQKNNANLCNSWLNENN